jgi:hypothetical protein
MGGYSQKNYLSQTGWQQLAKNCWPDKDTGPVVAALSFRLGKSHHLSNHGSGH